MGEKKNQQAIQINKNAPAIPQGTSLGKASKIYAYSNNILDLAPFIDISDAARTFYLYMTTIILEETQEAVNKGTYSFKDKSRRFFFNIREYLNFLLEQGKKHYTFEDIKHASEELVGQPLTFIKEDGESFKTVAFFSEIDIDVITGDCFFDVATSLLVHYVPELSEERQQHLLSLIESFKFSNSYADALYRLLNGYIQTVDYIKDYSISILVLKKKMGVTPEQSAWNNKYFVGRVLDKAVELINEISDITFEYSITKFEKQNRYKDIIFKNIQRKSQDNSNVIIDSIITKETIIMDDTSEKEEIIVENDEKSKSPISEDNEFSKAVILASCLDSGLNIEQSQDICEKYKNDYGQFTRFVEIFDSFLKYKIKTENERYNFFMNQELITR